MTPKNNITSKIRERAISYVYDIDVYMKSLILFSQIEVLQNAGFWDNIANRLYYSLFHAVSALLINEGLPVNSHKGAVLLFGQHFIKTQIFDKQYGKLYSQLQAMRERSDYNCYYDVSKEDILPLIEPVKELIDIITNRLQDA